MKMEVFYYLLAIEKYGSLNQAAEHLYVSQPNLTNVIRSLERELGYPVLSRGHNGVKFTEQGRQVLLAAHNIVRERDKLDGLGAGRQDLALKISIGHSGTILEELCEEISKNKEAQAIDVSIYNFSVMEALEGVYRQTLDIAYLIVPTTMDRTIRDYAANHELCTFFFRNRICQITLRKKHPMLETGFSKDALWHYPFVDFTDQYPDAYGVYQQYINPQKIIRVDHGSMRARIVAATDAYSIGMSHGDASHDDGLAVIPLPDLEMHLVELRRNTEKGNSLYNALHRRMEASEWK